VKEHLNAALQQLQTKNIEEFRKIHSAMGQYWQSVPA
jgi:hypothetical protein